MPNSLFQDASKKNVVGLNGYTYSSAPCICLTGKTNQYSLDHGLMHTATAKGLEDIIKAGGTVTYSKARDIACNAAAAVVKDDNGEPACTAECLAVQLDAYFNPRSKTGKANDIKVRQVDGKSGKKYPNGLTGDDK
jgi:hypothetical protein